MFYTLFDQCRSVTESYFIHTRYSVQYKTQKNEQSPHFHCHPMKTVNFTEFRRNASTYFDEVEDGEIVCVTRHGTPVARITPASTATGELAWKKEGPRISTGRNRLSDEITSERLDSDES